MFSEHYNSTMQNNKTQYLKNLTYETTDRMGNPITSNYGNIDYSVSGNTFKFVPNGNLNIRSIVFIVTDNTASASELLINIFKPYLPVKLIGEKTYGKPVGFFPLTIGGYDVYLSMFTSKNSNNESDYFDGMSVDKTSRDDPDYALGNLKEQSLQAAYNYLTTGSYLNSSSAISSTRTSTNQIKKLKDLSPNQFKGMVENRLKTK
ncbi:Peptidase family S41 [compost metagenome]